MNILIGDKLSRRDARLVNVHVVRVICMACLVLWGVASATDVFNTERQVSADPVNHILPGTEQLAPCANQPIASPVGLFDAVERALCASPKTRSAWADVKAASAAVGVSKAAYLPTLSASIQHVGERVGTQVPDFPSLTSVHTEGTDSGAISLGWVLYDFGNRSAALDSSLDLLVAAQANQNVVLQAVFIATAKDYYSAVAAAAKVKSTRSIEASSGQSLEAATDRVDKGVAPITDQLQANTAYAQAVYERAKAEGDSQMALGALASDMNELPDAPLSLPEVDQDVLPDIGFVHAVHALIEEAIRMHPSVMAAEAQWQAAMAKTRSVRAQGRPTLSLAGQFSRNNQPASVSLGQPELNAINRDDYLGIKVNIPLFEGFGRGYQIRQAEAEAESQEQKVHDVEQQIAIGVWSSYQILQADTENLSNTDKVLQSARQAFDAAQHRYRSGVGNILELLSVQNTLATAEQQRIQAQSDWRTARLQLAASLGQLGMWVLQ